MTLGLLAIGLLLVALLVIGAYNLLVRRRNAVDNAFAGIDAQLMMRYDLIPNLVAIVKRYASHESVVLHEVTELRTEAQKKGLGSNERVDLDNRINRVVEQIHLLSESYPELRASENFEQLQRALNEVEERIAASRRAFNAAATDYNNAVELFPLNRIAAAFDFKRRNMFVAAEAAHTPARVADAIGS